MDGWIDIRKIEIDRDRQRSIEIDRDRWRLMEIDTIYINDLYADCAMPCHATLYLGFPTASGHCFEAPHPWPAQSEVNWQG